MSNAPTTEAPARAAQAPRAERRPVSIVVPAYNEERGIGEQIERLRRVMEQSGWPFEVVVVDDGSTDRTAEEAAQHDVRLIRQPRNRGYGAALKAGIVAARSDWIVIIDADGTYPAEEIPAMLERAAEHDMVVGARTGQDVNIPLARRPAKWLLALLAGYLAEQPIPDLNSGLRVLKRELVEKYEHLLPSGFSFTTTITLALLCNDFSVFYHPINYARRVGASKIRPAHAYQFLMLILRTVVYFNPLRVFLPLGLVFFLAGLAKLIYDIFLWNLSESAVMGLLSGIIIWCVGLLADQISRIGMSIHTK
jgi:glycosyltransferase involved in cell wall biosynthesis